MKETANEAASVLFDLNVRIKQWRPAPGYC
jgi:hypothetical protein